MVSGFLEDNFYIFNWVFEEYVLSRDYLEVSLLFFILIKMCYGIRSFGIEIDKERESKLRVLKKLLV